MRRSQKNDSKFSRFAYYKYSGIIVFAPIIILAIGLYVYIDMENEFFSAWSCETISEYLMDMDVPDDIPNAHTLPEDQHLKLHIINDECVESEQFARPNIHP